MYQLSAAHKTLPLPSYVRVTNLANGESVVLRVNDRGPFSRTEDRLIDVSYAAAVRLGMVRSGTANVRVQALEPWQYRVAR
jgi:rare lipoprotein A